MKKILGLGVVAILVMAMVGGGTWAYFSDWETSTNNMLVAGTLDLGLANSSGGETGGSTSGTWTILTPSHWKPGDNVTGTLYAKNSGTIDMSTVNVTFSYVFTEGTPSTVKAGPGGSTDNLTNMITAETATWDGHTLDGTGGYPAIQGKNLDQLVAAGTMNLPGGLASNAEKALFIVWRFNSAATNGCQGDTANMTVTLLGTQ